MRFARRDLVATNNHTLRDKTGAYGALLFGFVCLLCFLFAQTRPGCPRVRRFTQRVMAAVAGDAENINISRRAIRVPTGSTPLSVPTGSTTSRTSKRQTSSCPRPQWGAPTPPSSADGPLHPSRTDHVVPNRCRGIACHVRECVVFLFFSAFFSLVRASLL